MVKETSKPEKTFDISRWHDWFPGEMTSAKPAQKFYIDYVSLQIWVVLLIG